MTLAKKYQLNDICDSYSMLYYWFHSHIYTNITGHFKNNKSDYVKHCLRFC